MKPSSESPIPCKANEITINGNEYFETVAQPNGSILVRPKWISVKDKEPPQDGSPFLCYDASQIDNFGIKACMYVVCFKEENMYAKSGYIEAGGECYFQWNPTHWMKLPEPPKE